MKLLITYLKKNWKLVLSALFFAAINQVFSLLDPYITGRVVDEIIIPIKDLTREQFFKLALYWLGASVFVTLVSRTAKNIQDYVTNVIIQKTGASIYNDGLQHALKVPYNLFEDQSSGETLSVLQKVRIDIERLINNGIGLFFTGIVAIVFVFVYAFSVSPIIALVFFIAIVTIGLVSAYLGKRIKKMQQTIVKETTGLAGVTTESLRNIELIKSLGLVGQEVKRLNRATLKILGLELKKIKFIRSLNFVQGTTVQLTRTTIIFLCLYLIFGDKLQAGDYFTFLFYTFFIFGALQQIGDIIIIYREAEISLNNLEKLMQIPLEHEPADAVNIDTVENVTFDNVSFIHKTAGTYAVKDISFEVRKGETIAFVGPSGAGKSTLVKLLMGLYRPASGKVLLNKLPREKIRLESLQQKTGFVTQDAQLFAGSIKDNLRFVNPNATDEQMIKALQDAKCYNIMNRAESGLDTLIGEGGVKISGGEKQRLSIARALLRSPELLVFDEATSALDSLTEEAISATVRDVSKHGDLLVVLIAHRLSTIMHSDRIYVLEKGEIVEQGSHDTLLELKGLYYAMWRQQIGERKHYEHA